MHYFVYILYSAKLYRYYIGRSTDPEKRLEFHNNPIEARKFTARGIPWKMMFSYECESLEESVKIERYLKKQKSRLALERLIADPSLIHEIIKEIRST